jgi:putative DNA primase/helicase
LVTGASIHEATSLPVAIAFNAGNLLAVAKAMRVKFPDAKIILCVWGAKAVAMIGALPDTIADRSINVTMRRRRPDEKIEKLRIDRTGAFSDLARRCARWSSDNMGRLKAADPSVPDSLHDRAADNWRPLLAIADAVGGKWPELARKAATALSGSESQDDDSAGVMLLTDIQTIFKEDGSLHIASADIVKKLVETEERPWPGLSGMTAQD